MKKLAVITLTALMTSAAVAPAAFAKGSSGDGWVQLQKFEAKRAELRADRAKGDKPSVSELVQKVKGVFGA